MEVAGLARTDDEQEQLINADSGQGEHRVNAAEEEDPDTQNTEDRHVEENLTTVLDVVPESSVGEPSSNWPRRRRRRNVPSYAQEIGGRFKLRTRRPGLLQLLLLLLLLLCLWLRQLRQGAWVLLLWLRRGRGERRSRLRK